MENPASLENLMHTLHRAYHDPYSATGLPSDSQSPSGARLFRQPTPGWPVGLFMPQNCQPRPALQQSNIQLDAFLLLLVFLIPYPRGSIDSGPLWWVSQGKLIERSSLASG